MPRPANCPTSALDPFSAAFLHDPYPHHATLRDAGPVVWLEQYGVIAMARYQQVRDTLADWETYCSSRGGGLTDFAKEEPWRPPSIILEADPPLHTRTRGVLGKVLSRPALQYLRERFTAKADEIARAVVAQGEIDAIDDLAEAFPLSVFPDAKIVFIHRDPIATCARSPRPLSHRAEGSAPSTAATRPRPAWRRVGS